MDLTARDREIIRSRGLREEDLLRQYRLLKSPPGPLKIIRPCTIGDGIKRLSEQEHAELMRLQEGAASEGRFTKFVPASGAATRMFQPLFEDRERVLQELEGHPCWKALQQDPERFPETPKALIPFHQYPDGPRTAFEEHLVEASLYIKDEGGTCRLHFTVSPPHLDAFRDFFQKVRGRYEGLLGVKFDVTFSIQEPSTDTIALDEGGNPFRTETGELFFRPGGHGALLGNLEALGGDLLYIKNVDNVAPDRLKPLEVYWKKVLGGYLIRLERTLKAFLRELSAGKIPEGILDFAREELSVKPPSQWSSWSRREKRLWLLSELNRPLRVCGMVPNEGQPVGGPFWVRDKWGREYLQIVEGAQLDASGEQRRLWESSTHFNPVDMVCSLRDLEGRPFRLAQFVDDTMVIVTEKNHRGKILKVLEWPGLWNGSMAGWLTVFIEVPRETFNPVKTLWDLLTPSHRA